MDDVSRDGNEVDSQQDPSTPNGVNAQGDTPSPSEDTDDTKPGPQAGKADYFIRTQETYKPLGVSDDIIAKIVAVEAAHEMLLSPRCNTAERKDMFQGLLSFATGEVLGALADEMMAPIGVIMLIAKAVRRLAPNAYDAWVDHQLSNGLCLGMVAAVRNLTDLPRERFIADQLAEGKLAAGSVTPVLGRLVNFVGILRPKLEVDLGVKTVADHLELDSALDAYLIARRIRSMAESLIAPIPERDNAMKGLKLLEQASAYDKASCAKIDRLRTRIQKRERRIQVGAQTNVPIQVSASMTEEARQAEAVPA